MIRFAAVFAFALLNCVLCAQAQTATPAEARAIAKEAIIYGFPLVDSYRIQYSYFVDRGGPEFKAPWNTLGQQRAGLYARRQGDPDAELRHALFVLSAPTCGPSRSCSPCRRSRRAATTRCSSSTCTRSTSPMSAAAPPATTRAASLLAGPGWKGEKPPGIKAVIRSETEFAFVLYRTQLFNPDDIDNVKRIQAGYKVQTALGSSLASPRRQRRRRSISSSRSRRDRSEPRSSSSTS